jgi:hypothetical protein
VCRGMIREERAKCKGDSCRFRLTCSTGIFLASESVLEKRAVFVPLPFLPPVKEHAMSVVEGVASYRSPRHKLLGFFESSRDKWKDKCKAAKVRLKRATNRVESLVRSRDLW